MHGASVILSSRDVTVMLPSDVPRIVDQNAGGSQSDLGPFPSSARECFKLHPACSTMKAIANSLNLAMCYCQNLLCFLVRTWMVYTHINRKDSLIVVNLHDVLVGMDIRVEIAWKSALQWISFRCKCRRVAESGPGHVVRSRFAICQRHPSLTLRL